MRYNPDSPPVGGSDGQEYWSLGWDVPTLAPPEQTSADARRSPIEQNVEIVGEVIASLQAPFVEAIEKGDGYEPYHSAEIKKLDKMRPRIEQLVRVFMVSEPVGPDFVREIIEQFDALDSLDAKITWMTKAQIVDNALEATLGNPELPAAA